MNNDNGVLEAKIDQLAELNRQVARAAVEQADDAKQATERAEVAEVAAARSVAVLQRVLEALAQSRRRNRLGAVALVLAVGFGAASFAQARSNGQAVDKVDECTTPGTECYRRARAAAGNDNPVLLLECQQALLAGLRPLACEPVRQTLVESGFVRP